MVCPCGPRDWFAADHRRVSGDLVSTALVTVVMNCFNGEMFLRHAIDSVIAQTWTHWEIVFWNNQSTDESAAIVKSYDDPRIRYFYAPSHTLLYEARNHAIQKANGQFLAFLDVDDWWSAEKLTKQINLFDDPDVALVYSNYWIRNQISGETRLAYQKPLASGNIVNSLLKDYRVGLLTLIIRKSHLLAHKILFDPTYHVIGDFDLVIRVAAQFKVAAIQTPEATYRVHGSNESIKFKELYLSEIKRWEIDFKKKNKAYNNLNLSFVIQNYYYVSALHMISVGKRISALTILSKMHWGRKKIIIVLAFISPVRLLRAVGVI